ncbi:MAG: hypothetical protein JXQ73_05840 [Phycisphaerae bacterium]|nr:hypothetical protein [Phycisphaerae bacterium]
MSALIVISSFRSNLEGPPAPYLHPKPTSRAPQPTTAAVGLDLLCHQQSEAIRRQIHLNHQAIVDPPFVVAGDLSRGGLAHWSRCVIRQAAEAMWRQYFRTRPNRPITVLLFSSEHAYRDHAKRAYGDDRVSYYGYYKPECHTMLLNISTGSGTLIHELTHALIEYDFPNVPDWFNEGLASLHEQCDPVAWQRGELIGCENWRLPALQKAVETGRFLPLRKLLTTTDFRGDRETLNYAQARYFCMYLQEQGVLTAFYERFRDGYKDDPTGLSYAEEVLGRRRIEVVEREFLAWVRRLRYRP